MSAVHRTQISAKYISQPKTFQIKLQRGKKFTKYIFAYLIYKRKQKERNAPAQSVGIDLALRFSCYSLQIMNTPYACPLFPDFALHTFSDGLAAERATVLRSEIRGRSTDDGRRAHTFRFVSCVLHVFCCAFASQISIDLLLLVLFVFLRLVLCSFWLSLFPFSSYESFIFSHNNVFIIIFLRVVPYPIAQI